MRGRSRRLQERVSWIKISQGALEFFDPSQHRSARKHLRDVLTLGSGLKMVRVHTGSIRTHMVRLDLPKLPPKLGFECESVDCNVLSADACIRVTRLV